ncbi:MAG: hypothetical protein ACOX6T_14950 [Myxococcales bacterium]|jgi:hypothetical protein
MAAEFIVAGRVELPERTTPWEHTIDSEQGGVLVYEASAYYDAAGREELSAQVAEVVGWEPKSIVLVRKAWDLARVVAEELEGAVFCDVDEEVVFDAAGKGSPADSLESLQDRLESAFGNPQPFFDRWKREEQERQQADPASSDANDWSDVE